ncbi:oligopeptide/dipeptide ABC transporter ATP-binding protein [Streptomyces sp. RTd22]|uniref:oligopeptide/dipeptide ABC transporter ATP-binding protein n=1 Tax=Streptomyces sp. RTd22 TaxID=1841249 RepID=UPI003B642341
MLGVLDRLRRELGLAIVVISHDLSTLAGIADRVAVLYRGRLVEQGPVGDVLERPSHPYTALLTASVPSVRRERALLPAQLRPRPDREPWPDGEGCVFAPRCRFANAHCRDEPRPVAPPVDGTGELAPDRTVACHHATTWRAGLAAEEPLTDKAVVPV